MMRRFVKILLTDCTKFVVTITYRLHLVHAAVVIDYTLPVDSELHLDLKIAVFLFGY